jgi:hypothetical protein
MVGIQDESSHATVRWLACCRYANAAIVLSSPRDSAGTIPAPPDPDVLVQCGRGCETGPAEGRRFRSRRQREGRLSQVARGAEGHRRDCPASLIAVESRIEDVSPGALGVTHTGYSRRWRVLEETTCRPGLG